MVLMELRDDRSEKIRYDYVDYPIYVNKGLLSCYPYHAAPVHWHDDLELIAVLSGEMQYNVNGEIIQLKKQEGIIVNAMQLHYGFSSGKQECEFICILLHPLMLCATAALDREYVQPMLSNRNAAFVKLSRDLLWQKEILDGIEQIYALHVQHGNTAPLKILAVFLNIWAQLYDNISQAHCPAPQNINLAALKNMVGFIQQNYTERLSLADIAASGAVGQSKCCKLFTAYTGQTPNEYLTQYRLSKSAQLLKTTDMTVTEIAHASGFCGSSYFAEVFHKWRGESPSAYRKRDPL